MAQAARARTHIFVHRVSSSGNGLRNLTWLQAELAASRAGKDRQGTGGGAQPRCFYGGAFPRTRDPNEWTQECPGTFSRSHMQKSERTSPRGCVLFPFVSFDSDLLGEGSLEGKKEKVEGSSEFRNFQRTHLGRVFSHFMGRG